ncbi:alpha/beta hydrolase [Actinoplanes sp. NPDC051851]|uniref:alpha/beta fold hydrolase n=1 Tax=Actinoplanes sp. NPDC051851 TaxID=3154753 RepID=UPI003425B719
MTFVQANGIRLHVQELNPAGVLAPRTAVLLHGLAADTMASWYFTLAYPLVEQGFRVVLQDLRGHGRSEHPASGYALADFVDDLDALLDTESEPVLLFGNSFGGTVAFGYAARHPERVAGIVAVESSPPTQDWFDGMQRRLRVRQPALAATTRLRDELPTSVLPEPASLAAIRCPVLCLYGGRSPVHGLAKAGLGLLSRVRTEVYPGQRHSLLVDKPDEVRATVTDWLRTEFPTGD